MAVVPTPAADSGISYPWDVKKKGRRKSGTDEDTVSSSVEDSSSEDGDSPVINRLKGRVGNDAETTNTSRKTPSSSDGTENGKTGSVKRTESLKSRSRIPPGVISTGIIIVCAQVASGLFESPLQLVAGVLSSLSTSMHTLRETMERTNDMYASLWEGNGAYSLTECLYATVVLAGVLSILYVLVYTPLRAGMWTGQRAKRHLVHRYMGLAFLIQYGLAWVEFITNYEDGARGSFLPHTIALNGMIQAASAYFSFKVLPSLDDAGYFSDKAVLSRNFVHENIFYQMLVVLGSLYYNDECRAKMQASLLGRVVEWFIVFMPYALLRSLFPTTRFKNAGTNMAGRTQKNERFYDIGTFMIKIFYLWAKYFLGFYINWLVFLGVQTEENMKFIRGLFLLNAGTVSIALFLHTLRFKKVLPPKFTFSLYIAQIYATFSAVPYAYGMFAAHKRLCALALSGVLCNMTRSITIHRLWCVGVFLLFNFVEVQW